MEDRRKVYCPECTRLDEKYSDFEKLDESEIELAIYFNNDGISSCSYLSVFYLKEKNVYRFVRYGRYEEFDIETIREYKFRCTRRTTRSCENRPCQWSQSFYNTEQLKRIIRNIDKNYIQNDLEGLG